MRLKQEIKNSCFNYLGFFHFYSIIVCEQYLHTSPRVGFNFVRILTRCNILSDIHLTSMLIHD